MTYVPNKWITYAYYHTLARSPFSHLSFTLFITSFSIFFYLLCFSSHFLYSPTFSIVLSLLCTLKALFLYCLQWWVFTVLPLNRFFPSISVLPKWPIGLSAAQPSPLTCASRAISHSQKKEFHFVFLLTVAFPFG